MNKSTTKLILALALFCSILKSQTNFGFVNGFVTDPKTNDTLIGALVRVDSKNAIATNAQGFYELKLAPGTYTLLCNMIGYKTFKSKIEIKENESTKLSVFLNDANTALDEVVISAGKFEQKLSEVTVSMEILKPSLIENKNVTSLDVIMNQVPGVTVSDGQASIRGGSGFS
jgi:outer membrane receptor for monomeric catechols